nr:MAG TPA: hypothetical protein [Caudoviricetes sp.]
MQLCLGFAQHDSPESKGKGGFCLHFPARFSSGSRRCKKYVRHILNYVRHILKYL